MKIYLEKFLSGHSGEGISHHRALMLGHRENFSEDFRERWPAKEDIGRRPKR